MADRIGVIEKGRLVQIGTPREIYEDPLNIYVATRLGQPADQPRCPLACCPTSRRRRQRNDDRRSHRARCASARPNGSAPRARSTGSSISATRTICMSSVGEPRARHAG